MWEKKTRPSLAHLRRMGGTYASSTFIGLLGLVDRSPELRHGDRVGMYSYGSGSCAEFYSGLLGRDAHGVAAKAGLQGALDARRRLSVREYEEAERERSCYIDSGDYSPSTDGCGGVYAERYAGAGRLVFQGVREHYRRYGWS